MLLSLSSCTESALLLSYSPKDQCPEILVIILKNSTLNLGKQERFPVSYSVENTSVKQSLVYLEKLMLYCMQNTWETKEICKKIQM